MYDNLHKKNNGILSTEDVEDPEKEVIKTFRDKFGESKEDREEEEVNLGEEL